MRQGAAGFLQPHRDRVPGSAGPLWSPLEKGDLLLNYSSRLRAAVAGGYCAFSCKSVFRSVSVQVLCFVRPDAPRRPVLCKVYEPDAGQLEPCGAWGGQTCFSWAQRPIPASGRFWKGPGQRVYFWNNPFKPLKAMESAGCLGTRAKRLACAEGKGRFRGWCFFQKSSPVPLYPELGAV